MENKNNNSSEKKYVNQIPYKFESSYIINDTMLRISNKVTSEKYIESSIMKSQLPYIFTNDPTPLTFSLCINELNIVKSGNIKVSWCLSNKEIKSSINLNFYLTENTVDKSCLVICEIFLQKRENIEEKYKTKVINIFPKVCEEIINSLEYDLQIDNNDIYHAFSKVFKYNRDLVFSALLNSKNIFKEKGLIPGIDITYDSLKVGSEILVKVAKDKTAIFKVIKAKTEKESSKWKVVFKVLSENTKDDQIQIMLIKINENETFVEVLNKYSEQIEPELREIITNKKRKLCEYMDEFLKIPKNSNKNAK